MTEPNLDPNDDVLASEPTVYNPDAFQGRTVLISGGAGGLGAQATWVPSTVARQVPV